MKKNKILAALLSEMEKVPSDATWRNLHYAAICVDTGLLDPDWYNREYPDVLRANMDPALHYVHFGYAEARAPAAWTDKEELWSMLGCHPELANFSFPDFLKFWAAWEVESTTNNKNFC